VAARHLKEQPCEYSLRVVGNEGLAMVRRIGVLAILIASLATAACSSATPEGSSPTTVE
jgi:hypothetical protein